MHVRQTLKGDPSFFLKKERICFWLSWVCAVTEDAIDFQLDQKAVRSEWYSLESYS